MLELKNLRVPASEGQKALRLYAARALELPQERIGEITILRRSVDARRKDDVSFVYDLALEAEDEASLSDLCSQAVRSDRVRPYAPAAPYTFPHRDMMSGIRPVVVGMGPAGLFAALCLAEAGLPCILLERGKPVEERFQDVGRFWRSGELDEESNVQYGEGGAGTFSDGKLTTGIRDERIPFVLCRFVEFGAPEDILYLNKPHIGTDRLRAVVANMRRELLRLGCDIRFGHRLDGLTAADGQLESLSVTSGGDTYTLAARQLILAPGNSARDTFSMLERSGVRLSGKNFSVGVRIEHRQQDVDLAQYGRAATLGTLPASDYKLAVHLDGGRSVYTFCVCPGGKVIAAASGRGQVVTNGMSEYARGGENCNGGLLVSVTPADCCTGKNAGDETAPVPPLSGVRFQESLEKAAFRHGGGNYRAPAQLVADFLVRRPSKGAKSVRPTYVPGVRWCNLWDVLPEFVCRALVEALPRMEKSVRGFASPDAVLTAVETRSSSPVRIDRENFQAVGTAGLYPCGEGAGYAGGIMSAAVDGIRCAEALCASLTSQGG